MSDSVDQLEALRNKIDVEDRKILESLSKRFKLCEQIGKHKKKNNMSLHQSNRWESLLENRLKHAKELGLDPEFTKVFFDMIHDLSKDIQSKTSSEVADE